ncbi:RNA-binding domain-containing protein [uncultured Roseobacter sp.]|uniref:RNA-binding domain-containing protein n=1 Tax=uncultured Roseobacter sp. TaxID=114847 RepID=UPI00260BF395|nr:RNA-binding domain-containing protein [uncultured Roseobacter sp.]
MITEQTLQGWRDSDPENENLEFKEAKTQYDRNKMFKYCVALANERGGYLVFGVSDKIPRQIVGTEAFPDLGKLKGDIRANTGLNVNVQELTVDGVRVLVLRAPSRPNGTAYDFKGAYYMRSGDELVPMTEDRLREIFNEGRAWDTQHILFGLEAGDVEELLDIGAFYSLRKSTQPDNLEESINDMVNLRLVHRDGKRLNMTNMAAMMLAKDLTKFSGLSRKAPRLIVYNGNNKLDTRHDIIGQRGYAVGFQGLVRECMTHIPQNEVVEDALRKTVPLLPERPLREILANALIHQDFYATGTGPIFEIYLNRLEVSNPGVPIVPVERFIDAHKSRNEQLAWAMNQFNICEERSSGIDRLVETAEFFQLPAPEFLSSFESTTVVVHGPRRFTQMTADDKIRACYQHCGLKHVMREQMTNESLCRRFGFDDDSGKKTVSRIIKATVDAGLVVADPTVAGSRKYARYVPAWSV